MTRATRLALALLLGAVAAAWWTVVPRSAYAEPPNGKATPVYVLSIWTDDADDPADALTQALRSRVRQASGWSLLETAQSFETLAIALKCPTKPDSACLLRIADQLRADHYVWGTMDKRRVPGEVTADVHLWSRGRGDVEADESYSENLKDASDESLRQIAGRLFGKLIGASSGGTLVVHAGTGDGFVTIDGVSKTALDGGVARVELPAGRHVVGVRVPGFDAPSQQASVPLGEEQELTFALSPREPSPQESPGGARFPVRAVALYSAIGLGAGLLVAGGVEGIAWLHDSNASKSDRQQVPASVPDVCAAEVSQAAADACQKSKDAVLVSTLGWIFAGVGAALVGTGFVLMGHDHDSKDTRHDVTPDARAKPRVQVLPLVGARSGALDLRVTF